MCHDIPIKLQHNANSVNNCLIGTNVYKALTFVMNYSASKLQWMFVVIKLIVIVNCKLKREIIIIIIMCIELVTRFKRLSLRLDLNLLTVFPDYFSIFYYKILRFIKANIKKKRHLLHPIHVDNKTNAIIVFYFLVFNYYYSCISDDIIYYCVYSVRKYSTHLLRIHISYRKIKLLWLAHNLQFYIWKLFFFVEKNI